MRIENVAIREMQLELQVCMVSMEDKRGFGDGLKFT